MQHDNKKCKIMICSFFVDLIFQFVLHDSCSRSAEEKFYYSECVHRTLVTAFKQYLGQKSSLCYKSHITHLLQYDGHKRALPVQPMTANSAVSMDSTPKNCHLTRDHSQFISRDGRDM